VTERSREPSREPCVGPNEISRSVRGGPATRARWSGWSGPHCSRRMTDGDAHGRTALLAGLTFPRKQVLLKARPARGPKRTRPKWATWAGLPPVQAVRRAIARRIQTSHGEGFESDRPKKGACSRRFLTHARAGRAARGPPGYRSGRAASSQPGWAERKAEVTMDVPARGSEAGSRERAFGRSASSFFLSPRSAGGQRARMMAGDGRIGKKGAEPCRAA